MRNHFCRQQKEQTKKTDCSLAKLCVLLTELTCSSVSLLITSYDNQKKIFSNCTTLLKVSVHLVFTRMGHGVFPLLPFHIISTTPQKDQLAKEVE
jgi:hypothetical protein